MRTTGSIWPWVVRAALVALLAFPGSACTGQTITLYPAGDTSLREGMPNTNYGTDIDITVRNSLTGSTDRVVLIGFDMSSVPSNACILQATLRLYQYETSYMDENDWLKVGAYRLLKHADEGTGGYKNGATWYYRHAGGADEWTQYGARGRSTDPDRHSASNAGIADSVVTLTRIPSGGPGRWVEWDVTPSAQYWHRNPTRNYGLVLDKWLEGSFCYDDSQLINFWAREYSDINYRPRLVVTYVVPTAQPTVTLGLAGLNLNFLNGDPNITFSQSSGQLLCSGTTSNTNWDMDGSATSYTLNSSFECDIQVKLQQGIVGVSRGQFGFMMYENSSKYVRMQAVGYGAQYYEVSGVCTASGNGKYHDGSYYWASYWDDGYPTGPPSAAVRFFSQTPENEATTYMTWKLRYDKPNQLLLVYVNGQLVTYYTKINFGTWRLVIMHSNDYIDVPTTVWTYFPDNTPPAPDPMTWASEPSAVSTGEIEMTATTATDDTPPVQYYFEETTGGPGGTSSGWITGTTYADTGLSANTQYGYRVKARDSASPPNETAYSSTVPRYTHMPAPTDVKASNVTATTVDLGAVGSFPNLALGQSGVKFYSPTPGGNGGIDEWIKSTTDQATSLTPNTEYVFMVKARNGDAVETDWAAGQAVVKTLAASPVPAAYHPVSPQGIRANWEANGNPAGTEYLCVELTTGRTSSWIQSTSWALTGLEPATVYHFVVKARNSDMKETAWVELGPIQTSASIGMTKRDLSPGDPVVLSYKVVSAAFPMDGLFFVQEWPVHGKPEGPGGIAVRYPEGMPIILSVGDIVDVIGRLSLNDPPYDQELVVISDQVRLRGRTPAPAPYGSCGRSLGGGPFGSQSGVLDDLSIFPPRPSFGLNVVGLLVRGWGKRLEVAGGGGQVWLDDGSMLNDGTEAGLRVSLRPLGGTWPFPHARYCAVTGVMRCRQVETTTGEKLNVRELWPRNLVDIVVYE